MFSTYSGKTSVPFRHSPDYEAPFASSSVRKRSRAVSLISVSSSTSSKLSFDLPKAQPTIIMSTIPSNAVGSFAPTKSASASLRFISTTPSRPSLLSRFSRHRRHGKPSSTGLSEVLQQDDFSASGSDASVPSISRTSSPSSDPDLPSPRPLQAVSNKLDPTLAAETWKQLSKL
ncbi:hypothetical protein PC9H_010761 [Pleurotus ostreatus]|uniref:Uncharacterized protein n=1 Tax=Pleurotus ostreatus TaxID=5322 RepID=A0A8H6ZKG4_PLEOS|nr:uncharacterized protein PC9H_010761 [Pleurotus ostreatus]KAF7422605.1 hypothetical protein PC9H_010761 [Pleurotus ostreatus]